MLVFGGADGGELTNDIVLFDLQPPAAHCKGVFCGNGVEKAPSPRAFHSAALWRAHMIIFGGWSAKAKGPANDLYVWDCEKQSWSGRLEVAGTPPSPRMNHSAVVHGDRMVIFGGQNEMDRNAEVHILTIAAQLTWSGAIYTQGQVPRPVSHHSACLHGDKMLVFGDNGDTAAVFCLDLAVSKLVWRHLEAKGEIPQPRLSHTSTMVANHMVLLGGERLGPEARQAPFATEHYILDLITTPCTWRRLPSEGAVPAARHMHTTMFHPSTMCLFMFGGSQVPTAALSKKNGGRMKALLSAKGALLRGLHILPLSFLISPASMVLPVDCALKSTVKNMRQVREQRAWFKDRIPQQFLRLAAFLHHDKADCMTLVRDITQVVAELRQVTACEVALLTLQAQLRLKGDGNSNQLDQLVPARDEARREFVRAAKNLAALIDETHLGSKIETMLVTHMGTIQNILALWDTDAAEDKYTSLIISNSQEDQSSEPTDARFASFLDAINTSEMILASFLTDEARVADELRRHTDGVAHRLQCVLLHQPTTIMNRICGGLVKGATKFQAMEAANTQCACNQKLYGYLGTQFSCWAKRWPQFPGEAKALWQHVKSGQVTMGEIGRGLRGAFPIFVAALAGNLLARGEFLSAPIVGPSYTYPEY